MAGQRKSFRGWIQSGLPWIWLNAAAVSACILLVTGLLLLIAMRGLVHFWPTPVYEFIYQDEIGETSVIMGEIRDRESVSTSRLRESGMVLDDLEGEVERILVKTGNRDLEPEDFRWVLGTRIIQSRTPVSVVALEREEWGVFYGTLVGLNQENGYYSRSDVWTELQSGLRRVAETREQIADLERSEISSVNYRLEQLRLEERELALEGRADAETVSGIELEREELQAEFSSLEEDLSKLYEAIRNDFIVMETASGQEVNIPLHTVIDAWRPNDMSFWERVRHFLGKIWAFVSEEPREANTEGGVFPAIFGTILMVLVMTVIVAPFGVIAAVYLKEYAKQGFITRTIRVAVNNLAGVPSIVYGVFGLGFFVYALGGSIDQLFFEAALPSPTFGTGGLFWAALTLALLTLPVVIVSTEEGLSRIPRAVREGSLALGATRWETLWRTVLPMASPGIITGLILAVARAAGEVAPLMLVGVVKLAPSLPLDGDFPFLHLERKFMHLGFHIYDVGFQSPNVEAVRPLVYATALLLVVVIVLLNLVAIRVRNNLREKLKGLET